MLENPSTAVLPPEVNASARKVQIGEMIGMARKIAREDGRIPTVFPFLTVSRNSWQTPPIPCVLTPSFCLILQGTKKIHLGQDIHYARPGQFLSALIDLPAIAQIDGASSESPYIGLRIDLSSEEIASVIMEAGIEVKPREKKLDVGAFIGQADEKLLDLFIRLLKLADNPQEAKFLSSLIKREMIFHLLSGEYGHLFFQKAFFDQQADGVTKALAWIKEHFASSFTVEELARSCNMSVSGLHHKFKALTSMGLLQYQKQLRLQEARRLMLIGAADATTAALEVGYESISQFNREYRRLFGLPPVRDIKEIRKHSAADAFQSLMER